MTGTLLVNLAMLAFMVWVVWYFFLARAATVAAAVPASGLQQIEVLVKGGYQPDVIQAVPNVPLRLRFRREENSACSEQIVFPDFGVQRHLPAYETTIIDLPAAAAGTYRFACGMDMLHGMLVLGDAGPGAAAPAQSQKRSCCGGAGADSSAQGCGSKP